MMIISPLITKGFKELFSTHPSTSERISRLNEIAKKLTEEAGETSIAAVTEDGRVIDESADLLFHLLVLLKSQNYSLNDVMAELKERRVNQ